MLALGTECKHPASGKPYIKVHGGGRDNSKEGKQVSLSCIPLQRFSFMPLPPFLETFCYGMYQATVY